MTCLCSANAIQAGAAGLRHFSFPAQSAPATSFLAAMVRTTQSSASLRAAAKGPRAVLLEATWTRREVFQAWKIYLLENKCATLHEELVEAREKAKPNSIWNMRKADLVELARKELEMRPDQANRYTVIELRELLRRERKAVEAFADPHASLPKGMYKMKREELIEVCAERNIALSSRPTRAEMMLAIRAQVEELVGGTYEMPLDEEGSDWEMTLPASSSRRSPRR